MNAISGNGRFVAEDAMSDFFYRSGPNEYGPLTPTELKRLVSAGRVVGGDEVRRGRQGNWVRAATVDWLFDKAKRDWEKAINEMDVMTEVRPPEAFEVAEVPEAKRETASEAETGQDLVVTPDVPSRLPAERSPADLPGTIHESWAAAVAALCYLAAAAGLALGAFSFVGARNIEQQILGGACFLIAIVALAVGFAIRLLADMQTRQPKVR
jgi:hypothetical protein